MSTKKEYEAIVLTEESEYELTDDFAESFTGMDITLGPNLEEQAGEGKIVGTVDDSEYREGEGIVCDITIYDEEMIDKIDKHIVTPCPMVMQDISDQNNVQGMGTFLTEYPGSEVGSVSQKD